LVASKIEEEEVKREKEVETVSPTCEIKEVETVIPTVAIKLKQVQKEEVMQKNVELNGIPKLVHEYTNKYSNYIYYHWVQQSSILKSSSHSNNVIGHKFPIFPTQCTVRFIPILGTSKQLM
jgi:hypothetical protein